MHPRIIQGIFDRYYIFHPTDDRMAWSGARWVPCWPDGMPLNTQVCNFSSEGEALQYINEKHSQIVLSLPVEKAVEKSVTKAPQKKRKK